MLPAMDATLPPAPDADPAAALERPVGPILSVFTGFLMGLANLVPGLSGGTMILIMGLYERFVAAIAEVTSLRPKRSTIVFLGLFGVGLVLALGGFSKVAVWAVVNERMGSFALFVGLTLGVVPELFAESRPRGGSGNWVATLVAVAAGFALVVGLGALDVASGSDGWLFLALVGALAASSMILPGVSGSYVLLLFGVYETVIGSLSVTHLRAEPAEALAVLVPVGVGVVVGIGAFSNLLKVLLVRASRATHGVLLGLVLGSVVGLWPFQSLVHPELARSDERKAIAMLVVDEAPLAEIREARGVDWDEARAAELAERFAGYSKGDLKLASNETQRFTPTGLQGLWAVLLVLLGLVLTRVLARIGAKHGDG
jgi:putative membrane protein